MLSNLRTKEMALVPLSSIVAFFDGEAKLTNRGENAFHSNRIMSFLFDKEPGHISATVQASMKDKTYEIQVSSLKLRVNEKRRRDQYCTVSFFFLSCRSN